MASVVASAEIIFLRANWARRLVTHVLLRQSRHRFAGSAYATGEREPCSRQNYDVALDTTLATPPVLNIWVQDVYPGGPNPFIRTAVRQGARYRVLIDNRNDIRGECLRVFVEGVNVKSGGEGFYATDYYWTTPNAYHIEEWIPYRGLDRAVRGLRRRGADRLADLLSA